MVDLSPAQLMIELIDEVYRLRGRFTSALSDIREASGLSQAQSLVLSATVNAVTPPTVPQIGRSLGHSRQVIQRSADELVERDLICWIANPDHKRARRLIATGRGRTVHADADKKAISWAEQMIGSVDPERLAETIATLRYIRSVLQTPPCASSVLIGEEAGSLKSRRGG